VTRSAFFLALLAAFGIASSAAAQDDERLTRSRELATELQQALGARLTAALGERGPVGAIEVCSLEAPEIAARLSTSSGAAVGRTSLRVRNPANEPDDEARTTLERFELAWQRDASAPPEDFAVATDGSARYMRAIPTQPLCVTCHGPAIAPELAAAIAERYPTDRATGFAPGSLRGAFLIEWPAAAE
jgi:mono/diheme cytochrome c family protein